MSIRLQQKIRIQVTGEVPPHCGYIPKEGYGSGRVYALSPDETFALVRLSGSDDCYTLLQVVWQEPDLLIGAYGGHCFQTLLFGLFSSATWQASQVSITFLDLNSGQLQTRCLPLC